MLLYSLHKVPDKKKGSIIHILWVNDERCDEKLRAENIKNAPFPDLTDFYLS